VQKETTACTGVYAYQCIQDKVDNVIEQMRRNVERQKQECIDETGAYADEAAKEIANLSADLQKSLANLRDEQTLALNERLNQAREDIEDAAAEAQDKIHDEAEARVNGESEASQARVEAQNDIKKIYYESGASYDTYSLKQSITERVIEFENFVKENEQSFEDFVAQCDEEVETIIGENRYGLDSLSKELFGNWKAAASEAQAALSGEIVAKMTELDDLIKAKKQYMDDLIATLSEDYIIVFWDTVEEVYDLVNYYERQGLIWKALYQKKEFINSVTVARDWLVAGLAEVRANFVQELNGSRALYASTVKEERNSYQE
jgi:hypothetical protein